LIKVKVLYTAVANATGGRDGQVKSGNGIWDLQVRASKAMGGASDEYTNPEQLFAAGYAACFDSALNHIIRLEKISAGTTSVAAKVSIGSIENGAFGLAVELTVNIPDVSPGRSAAPRRTGASGMSLLQCNPEQH
jgi:osmotically inducible protein OsmC